MDTAPATAPLDRGPSLSSEFTNKMLTKLVAGLIFDDEVWQLVKDHIRPEYFENPVRRDLTRIILAFAETYHRPPTMDELIQEMDFFLAHTRKPLPTEVYWDQTSNVLEAGAEGNFDYVRDRVDEFFRYQALKNTIVKSVDLLQQKKDYDGILSAIKEAYEVGQRAEIDQTVAEAVSLDSVTSRQIPFLMKDRIPLGVVTLITGAGEVGKSTLLTEIACRISRGEPLPGSTGAEVEAGSTIYITTENPAEEVLRPRVLACDGDSSKIFHLQNVLVPSSEKANQPRVFDVTRDLPALAREMDKIKDVRLVIIDPAISHIPDKLDPNATAQVRHVMDTLFEFAQSRQIAVICVMHLAKGVAVSAVNKIAGSHKWKDAARVVLGVAPDKNDLTHERRFLSRLKANLDITYKTLAFRIKGAMIKDPNELDPEPVFKTTRVEFEPEELDMNTEEMFNPDPGQKAKPEGKLEKAVEFLRSLMKEGVTEIPAQAVEDEFPDISVATWCRARQMMGMKKPEQTPDGWIWRF